MTAVIGAIVVFGGAILYVANLRTDIAVASAEIKALQKSQDSWTTVIKDEIKRVESSLEAKLLQLAESLQGRRVREADQPSKGQRSR